MSRKCISRMSSPSKNDELQRNSEKEIKQEGIILQTS
jgi:hypothetical protein